MKRFVFLGLLLTCMFLIGMDISSQINSTEAAFTQDFPKHVIRGCSFANFFSGWSHFRKNSESFK